MFSACVQGVPVDVPSPVGTRPFNYDESSLFETVDRNSHRTGGAPGTMIHHYTIPPGDPMGKL